MSKKLELHYFFTDDTHTMNAFIRNECEKELLSLFKEIYQLLDIDISIESEAYREGGLKEIWTFLGKHGTQLTLIIAIISLVLSRIPTENKKLTRLQIENLELDNELKRQELKKIKNQIKSEEEITDEVLEKVLDILENDYKVTWRKSNFYRRINLYPKISKVSTQKLDIHNVPVERESVIERKDFSKFILQSNKLPPRIDENAVIDIISPVLKNGNFSWKGFYQGDTITFDMADISFKNSVLNKEVEFVNGTAIKCVLQQNRNIDEVGLIKINHNKVLTVLDILTEEGYQATEQGRKYLRNQTLKKDQLKLDL